MVPPTVEKAWKGVTGAAVLWLPGLQSYKEAVRKPRADSWDLQMIRMKMFDNLIGNHDRNMGNLLVDADGNVYLIDHSRAFISDTKLPATHQRIDRVLWDKFQALDEPGLAPVQKWVGRGQVRALLKRRDKMKVVIDELVQKSSPLAVFIK
jgi:hypothetical protein